MSVATLRLNNISPSGTSLTVESQSPPLIGVNPDVPNTIIIILIIIMNIIVIISNSSIRSHPGSRRRIFCTMSFFVHDGFSILCQLHSHLLRELSNADSCHYMGLAQAARSFHRSKRTDNRLAAKLRNLDTAYTFARDITAVHAAEFARDVLEAIVDAEQKRDVEQPAAEPSPTKQEETGEDPRTPPQSVKQWRATRMRGVVTCLSRSHRCNFAPLSRPVLSVLGYSSPACRSRGRSLVSTLCPRPARKRESQTPAQSLAFRLKCNLTVPPSGVFVHEHAVAEQPVGEMDQVPMITDDECHDQTRVEMLDGPASPGVGLTSVVVPAAALAGAIAAQTIIRGGSSGEAPASKRVRFLCDDPAVTPMFGTNDVTDAMEANREPCDYDDEWSGTLCGAPPRPRCVPSPLAWGCLLLAPT